METAILFGVILAASLLMTSGVWVGLVLILATNALARKYGEASLW